MKYTPLFLMSKAKKSSVNVDYSELKEQMISNVKNLKESSSQLFDIYSSVFSVDSPTVDELSQIKKEWVESSNKINNLDDLILTLLKDKTEKAKKMEDFINKKGKKNSDAEFQKLKEEWLEVTNQISVINSQLESYNNDRAKLISKSELYFSKLDSVKKEPVEKKTKSLIKKEEPKTTKSKTKKASEESEKCVPKKTTAKKEVEKKVVEKVTKKKVEEKKVETKKKPSKEEKKEDTSQIKLRLDSESTDTSESDTDSSISSVDSDNDSGSESESSDSD